jgi:hypothetical protein
MVFACGIDGQDTKYTIRKFWGFVIHLEESFGKNFLPDTILIKSSQSPPYEYIEGGDFRNSLKQLTLNYQW